VTSNSLSSKTISALLTAANSSSACLTDFRSSHSYRAAFTFHKTVTIPVRAVFFRCRFNLLK
jgi:hypothetical protein